MKTFLRVFIVAVFLGITVLYNFGLIDIRFEEIRYLLGAIASQDEASNTFGIVAKYELIKRRMIDGEDNVSDYELEAKIQALSSNATVKAKKNTWTLRAYRIPLRAVINATRMMLGKKIISPKDDDKIIDVLEIGYFWERNRKYGEALKIYDDVLKTAGVAPAIKAAVLVHRAFCISMLGDYKEAKAIYEQVINRFPNTEAGVLSWKLLDFIQSMETGRDSLDKKQLTEIDKARKFYAVMDFRNAIKNYSVLLEHKPAPEVMAEARYYKGRAHEELGETEEAIVEYRTVMRDDVKKEWAKKANRRLLMIGQFYDQQKDIADEAKKQLAAYQDQKFFDNVQQYAQLVAQTSLRSELMKDAPTASAQPIRDSLLNAILTISDLDLTGEKNAVAQQKKLDSLRNVLVEKGAGSQAEMKELSRWQTVTQNPFRRPTVLKTVIDGYGNELKYIYNKRLRRGVKLTGKMFVTITIKADGTVDKAVVAQSDMGDQEFEKEITARILTWKFRPVPDSVGDLSIKYPFEFTEEEQ